MARSVGTKVSPGALIVLALVALGAYALDQSSKTLVIANLTEGEVVRVLGDVLHLHFVRNPGAAFSLASGMTWIFSIIATAVVVFIIWFASRIRSIAWSMVFGLLLGGVLGNLTDRLLREPAFGVGHVIDFISTPWMLPAIYNVADIFIVSSMILFMILTIRGVGLDGRRTGRPRHAASHRDASVSTGSGTGAEPGTTGDGASPEPGGTGDGAVRHRFAEPA